MSTPSGPAAPAPALTTTSYGILGLLAIRPWSSYELTQQMDRSFRHFWPRARSKLYEEPKKLVAHGLADADAEHVGMRKRTVYSITRAGRRALAAWLAEPGDGPELEFEQLMKVFFAEHGSRDATRANLEAAREWAEARRAQNRAITRSYLDGEPAVPGRMPQLLVVGRFLNDFTELVAQWAEWALDVVDQWPDDMSRLGEVDPDRDMYRRLDEDPGYYVRGGKG
jgi:DNA-binding PadR family transcriptional regulator